MVAALKGNIDIVKILIQNGAEIKAKTSDGATALNIAKQAGNNEIVSFLRNVNNKH